jgi:multisubunit Na+/H+ antiporter MnhG subunit
MTDQPAASRPLDDPGRSAGIIGLIFSVSGVFCVFVAIVGIVVSSLAYRRSKREGFANRYALIGIIVGAAFAVVNLYLSLPWLWPLLTGRGA